MKATFAGPKKDKVEENDKKSKKRGDRRHSLSPPRSAVTIIVTVIKYVFSPRNQREGNSKLKPVF